MGDDRDLREKAVVVGDTRDEDSHLRPPVAAVVGAATNREAMAIRTKPRGRGEIFDAIIIDLLVVGGARRRCR